MTIENVAEKVRKLLRLATSSNVNEAALAAAKAQQLIDEHNLTDALLSIDSEQREPDESIEDFGRKGAPLDTGKKLDRWRWYLASTLLRANGCAGYVSGGDIHIIGRPMDADAVRYLYAYLKREVEQLVTRNARGCGRTYVNNYRLGVVDTIAKKVNSEREAFRQKIREEASRTGGTALVRVNTALTRIDQKHAEAVSWTERNMNLRSSGRSSSRLDFNARAAGQRDGQSIAVNTSRSGLGTGRKAIGK
jgi:hypothetical protein